MILELTKTQVIYLQELIYTEIDRINGYDELSPEIQNILEQIRVLQYGKAL